jgi:DNA polymerase zeta
VKNPQFDPQRLRNIHVDEYDDELELIHSLVDLVHELDPDILAGWEVQRSSWGYLATRGREHGNFVIRMCTILRLTIFCSGLSVTQLLSRAPHGSGHTGSDNWSTRHTANFKVTGRHVLNVWRVMRAEQTLGMYSFENFVFHILHQRYEVPSKVPQSL